MIKIKFVRKANMWCHIFIRYEKGKKKQDIKWFITKEKAEDYDDKIKNRN